MCVGHRGPRGQRDISISDTQGMKTKLPEALRGHGLLCFASEEKAGYLPVWALSSVKLIPSDMFYLRNSKSRQEDHPLGLRQVMIGILLSQVCCLLSSGL